MDIDLVYLWVDGNDPEWQAKRNAFIGNAEENTEINCKGRYANNDELKYSLRSAEKYAPWLRKIFIVTDNQTPDWLDTTNPKIKIIDHREIMPEESLPCFNSSVIEYFLHKIPDLSECFLLSNDDTFFSVEVSPGFFFAKDGFPFVRLNRKPFNKLRYWKKFLMGKKPGQYRKMVWDAAHLVKKKFGKYYSGIPHHNVDAYKKTDYCTAMENVFGEEVKNSLIHRVRTEGDLHRSIISYYALAIGRGHLKYVGKREATRISVYKSDFMKYILRYQPKLFCLNDSEDVNDEDRIKIKPFLETLFPEKSQFEK